MYNTFVYQNFICLNVILQSFLPSFPENDAAEKDETVKQLFHRENIRFGNPLTQFHNHLQAGHFRPDISKMRQILRKARYKEYR